MRKFFLVPALTALCLAAPAALTAQTTATWNTNSGTWETAANWTPMTVPNGVGDTAIFSNPALSGTLNSIDPITLGHLELSAGTFDTQIPFMFNAGGQTATFNVTGGSFDFSVNSSEYSSDLIMTNTTGSPFRFEILRQFANPPTLTFSEGEFEFNSLDPVGLIVAEGAILREFGTGIFPTFLEGGGDVFIQNGFGISGSPGSHTFSGNLTGGVQFSKSGDGVAVFTGIVDFSNVYTISEPSLGTGGISISSADSLRGGSIDGIIFGNIGLGEFTGTLTVTGNTPFSLGQLIRPSGNNCTANFNIGSDTALTLTSTIPSTGSNQSLIKTGGGGLILTNSCDLPPTVNAGTLTVFGTVSQPTTVNSGGTLNGTGTLQTVTVNSGATIRPGASVGTMNITGNLTLNSGSITQIEISPSSASKFVVAGLTTLGGSLQVIQPSGNYPGSASYPIVVADGGITGSFSSISGGLPGYTFSLTFDLASSSLLLSYLFSGIPTSDTTGPGSNLADYLNNNAPGSPVTQALLGLSGKALQDALDSISPSRNSFAPYAAESSMFAWSNLLTGHLSDQRAYHAYHPIANRSPSLASLFEDQKMLTANASGRMALPATSERHSWWIGTVGEYARQDALDQNPAFNYWASGGMLGIDTFNDRHIFGLGAGGAYTEVDEDNNAGKVNIASYFVTIYDTLYGPAEYPVFFEFAAWGVYNQIRNARHVVFPGVDVTCVASFNSWQFVPHLAIGYHSNRGGDISIDPFLQADLACDWQQSFEEEGGGFYDWTQVARNSQFLRTEAGFRFYQTRCASWGSWLIMEKVSYVNRKTFGTGDVAAAIFGTSTLFDVETFRNTQNLASAGLEFLWRKGTVRPITFSIAYNAEYGSQYWSQQGLIRFMKDF